MVTRLTCRYWDTSGRVRTFCMATPVISVRFFNRPQVGTAEPRAKEVSRSPRPRLKHREACRSPSTSETERRSYDIRECIRRLSCVSRRNHTQPSERICCIYSVRPNVTAIFPNNIDKVLFTCHEIAMREIAVIRIDREN